MRKTDNVGKSGVRGYLILLALAPLLTLIAERLTSPLGALCVALATCALAYGYYRRVERPKSGELAQVGIETIVRQRRRDGQGLGMVLFELDQRESLMQPDGGACLQQVSARVLRRIKRCLRDEDHIFETAPGRYALLPAASGDLSLETVIKLCKRVQQAVRVPEMDAKCTLSAGFYIATRIKSPSTDELFSGAEQALAEARQNGPNALRSYCGQLVPEATAQGGLLEDLGKAIRNGELRAYFQPQISAHTGAITGFEALVRWQHPERGLIPPMEFLPLLEKSGDIPRITELMISQSLEAIAHWRTQGYPIPRVGINFSTADLLNPNLVDMIAFELERHNLSAEHLSIEVLETVAAGPSDGQIAQTLRELADLGCCIDLDDFGTGYASITSINQLCIERIKIDRSFVTGITTNPEQQKLVSAILTMAEKLGLSTVAEGVESEDERDYLTRLGCLHLQGFGIGRPMPLADAEKWISAYLAKLAPEQIYAN